MPIMDNEIVGRVGAFIRQRQLLAVDALHLVALSGGADSVALLLILRSLGYKVEAVHCNFHLRAEESDRDERFVCRLCQKTGTPIHLTHFDTRTYADLHKVSIEMAARELRYRYFDQLRGDVGADRICVAHHRDDAVETLLMNLMRGTGVHGLTGIRAENGHVVRPLLCLSRKEIEGYLKEIGQDYVVDSTNLVADVLRNKIRLRLLPLMQDISLKAVEGIAQTMENMAEVEKIYNNAVSRQLERIVNEEQTADGKMRRQTVVIKDLLLLPSPSSILLEWLVPFGFSASQVRQISAHLIGQSGRCFESVSHLLVIDRDSLILDPIAIPMKPMIIPETGLYRITDSMCMKFETLQSVTISKQSDCATIDNLKVELPLTVRLIQPSDRFTPYGMNGSRLVSDFLTDRKVSLPDKRRQMVVTDHSGRIVWLVGHRIDQRFRVSENTSSILRITCVKDV